MVLPTASINQKLTNNISINTIYLSYYIKIVKINILILYKNYCILIYNNIHVTYNNKISKIGKFYFNVSFIKKNYSIKIKNTQVSKIYIKNLSKYIKKNQPI